MILEQLALLGLLLYLVYLIEENHALKEQLARQHTELVAARRYRNHYENLKQSYLDLLDKVAEKGGTRKKL